MIKSLLLSVMLATSPPHLCENDGIAQIVRIATAMQHEGKDHLQTYYELLTVLNPSNQEAKDLINEIVVFVQKQKQVDHMALLPEVAQENAKEFVQHCKQRYN